MLRASVFIAFAVPPLLILTGLVLVVRSAGESAPKRMAKAVALWLAVSLSFGTGEFFWFLVFGMALGPLDWGTGGAPLSWWIVGFVILSLHAWATHALVKSIRRW